MPPGPAYNWLCVLHSVGDVLYHAAHIRASQVAPRAVIAVRRTTVHGAPEVKANWEFEAAELAQQRAKFVQPDLQENIPKKAQDTPFVVPPGPKVESSIQFRKDIKPNQAEETKASSPEVVLPPAPATPSPVTPLAQDSAPIAQTTVSPLVSSLASLLRLLAAN